MRCPVMRATISCLNLSKLVLSRHHTGTIKHRMFPDSMIAMHGMKAEGGWGIVATEQCDFHPTGDVQPYTETRLWGDMDISKGIRVTHEFMCHAVKALGSGRSKSSTSSPVKR